MQIFQETSLIGAVAISTQQPQWHVLPIIGQSLNEVRYMNHTHIFSFVIFHRGMVMTNIQP